RWRSGSRSCSSSPRSSSRTPPPRSPWPLPRLPPLRLPPLRLPPQRPPRRSPPRLRPPSDPRARERTDRSRAPPRAAPTPPVPVEAAPTRKRNMANYTAADSKEIREATGAGMLDVKKALDEANGDKTKAVELIRVKGLKGIAKREGRTASEGLIAVDIRDT